MTIRNLMMTTVLSSAALCLVACSADADGAAGSGFDGGGAEDGGGGEVGGDDGPVGDDGGPSPIPPGVGQGGAQDFGQFRAILEAGQIPGPDTLDDVGFFNEHKIELPGATCGSDVCVHGALGQMGNLLTGADCMMVMVGMNTPIDPAELERPALNLAIAVDTSGSMQGEPIERVREGLFRMVDVLQPEDRVTLVTFNDAAVLQAEFSGGDSAAIEVAIAGLTAEGQTNIYDGLWSAYEAVEAGEDPGLQNRVILLSDGEANTGITNDDKIVNLATALSGQGIGLSTIGLGEDFDPLLMRRLSEVGGGTFYFLEDPAAVEEVFEEEVSALLMPLATQVEIGLDVFPGWEVRGLYGTKLAEVGPARTSIEIPSLHIAHRETVDDVEHGRRGGGGVILAEVMREPGAPLPEGNAIGSLTMDYVVPGTEETVSQTVDITSPDPEARGYFSTTGAEKSFVMLNLYVGFRIAAERATVGDDTTALATLQGLHFGVRGWLDENDDFDIEDDLRYVDLFIDNLRARGAAEPPPQQNPPEPWPQD
ncbi:MAG: VWA domain-containing protein [Myxococcota bacterium]